MVQSKPLVYISVSTLRNGPIPWAYSMLHLSAVAFDEQGKELDTFSTNIQPMPGAASESEFLDFLNEEEIENLKIDAEDAYGASINFAYWVARQRGRAVFVSLDAAQEFSFVNWYMHTYAKANPFSEMLDVKSYMLGRGAKNFVQSYREIRQNIPEELRVLGQETNNQWLDRARWIGRQLINLLLNKKVY